MSYEIYKSVKQLVDGTFECVSSSSNVYPKDFRKWNMNYFNKEFPTVTNEEKRALWMLFSRHWGDKFYQSNWKNDQKLASKFCQEKGYNTWEVARTDKDLFLKYAQEFIEWKKDKTKIKKHKYVVSMIFGFSREYVGKKSSKRVWPSYSKNGAKVFKAETSQDVLNLFSGYSKYEPQVEEI